MKQTLLKAGIACAAVAMLGTAVAQSGSAGGQAPTTGGSYQDNTSGSSPSQRQLSSTGHSSSHSQQAIRASKVIGADVKGTSGNRIGQIEDVILNPTSGRVELAVISRSGMGGSGSTSSTSSGMGSSTGSQSTGTGSGSGSMGTSDSQNRTGTSGSQSTSGGMGSSSTYGSSTTSGTSRGELVAVPWSLLKPASASGTSSMTSTSGQLGGQESFTLNVSESKLDQAPSLSSGSWSEISRPEWRQRVYSHFGVSSSSSTGGAESPYGQSTGSNSGTGSSDSHTTPDNP